MPASERHDEFECPVHGGDGAYLSWKPDRDGTPRFFLHCNHTHCAALGNGPWLRALTECVGAPSVARLLDDPRPWLEEHLRAGTYNGRAGRARIREAAPTERDLRRWERALPEDAHAYQYLTEQRGLTEATIRKHRIGYAPEGAPGGPVRWRDYAAFTLPIFGGDDELIGFRKRFWPDVPEGKRYVGLTGWKTVLVPGPPRRPHVLLVKGHFDALLGRQELGPRVAVVSEFANEHAPAFAGRLVAVIYDVGEELAAGAAVERLRAAGADEAWTVPLGLAKRGEDLTDWFITHGRSAGELRRLINDARPKRKAAGARRRKS